jgi:two-component system, NtrC family, sensor histidine kinase HydH
MAGPSAAWSRWGLLLTTLAMGLALVVTAVGNYRVARLASAELLSARSRDLSFAVHRVLRAAGAIDADSVNMVLEETSEHGLRGLTVLASDGVILASAGIAASNLEHAYSHCRPRLARAADLDSNGENVQIAIPLMPGSGRGRRFGQGAAGRPTLAPPLAPPPVLAPPSGALPPLAPPFAGPAPAAWADACLILVLDPSAGHQLVRPALTNLAIALVVALGSLVLAAFFWRLSRRAEAFATEIARDRQLKALGEMSAVLGHEIRNPLASLKGHAQLLREKMADEDPRRVDVDTVVTESVRLEQLVNEVLAFARTSTVQTAPEDPIAVARSAIEHSGAEGVALDARNDLGLWPLDRPRVEQVLANLLRNAAQESPPHSPIEMTVSLADGALEYSVQDHGPGIKPEDLEQIFEPFFTRRVRGTGLGLTIAKRIVQSHGGQISATNSPDGGAVFIVRLPRLLPAK